MYQGTHAIHLVVVLFRQRFERRHTFDIRPTISAGEHPRGFGRRRAALAEDHGEGARRGERSRTPQLLQWNSAFTSAQVST